MVSPHGPASPKTRLDFIKTLFLNSFLALRQRISLGSSQYFRLYSRVADCRIIGRILSLSPPPEYVFVGLGWSIRTPGWGPQTRYTTFGNPVASSRPSPWRWLLRGVIRPSPSCA